jgi:hypothetical protein
VRVPPTYIACVPPTSAPDPEGLLAGTMLMLFPPFIILMEPGRVMVYALVPSPVTVNKAAWTRPVTAGRVIPPVNVRTGVAEGGKVTVPPGAVGFTAMLPKLMSRFFAMPIGVMIFAEALAVAEVWAKVVAIIPEKRTTKTKIFFMVFIVFEFLLF